MRVEGRRRGSRGGGEGRGEEERVEGRRGRDVYVPIEWDAGE
jgi:hypothetical protein